MTSDWTDALVGLLCGFVSGASCAFWLCCWSDGLAVDEEPCPTANATHYITCADNDPGSELYAYKNGGYVCAEYGGVVEMGENCTLVPLPPALEAP